jgi:hypothetical protein
VTVEASSECQSKNLAFTSGATACAVTPDGRWSGRPESNRRRPAWEFPYGGLTKCHSSSEFITSGHTVGPSFSRFVIPSHAIWAASWASFTPFSIYNLQPPNRPDDTGPAGGAAVHTALVLGLRIQWQADSIPGCWRGSRERLGRREAIAGRGRAIRGRPAPRPRRCPRPPPRPRMPAGFHRPAGRER